MQPGQTVVIIGASSGTGLMGVQIAKALGAARVIGVCSEKNAELVKQLGADVVIDYTTESWWQNAALLLNKADIVCVFVFYLFCKCCCLSSACAGMIASAALKRGPEATACSSHGANS
jgi:D-arabinose 1-dehydrogenase-like Zn-dependent alcohol dehydrogenase